MARRASRQVTARRATATAAPVLTLSAVEPAAIRRAYPPPGTGEPAWPAQLAVLAAIGLQLALPDRLTVGPRWILPVCEGALLLVTFFATPNQLEHHHPRRRLLALAMTALVSAANVYSLYALAEHLIQHGKPDEGRALLGGGALIWLTNVIIFAIWYWEMDRGGPGVRAAGADRAPDLLFPQMMDDTIEPRGWRPRFLDYGYVAFTNATAFSPTDTMPLSATAKSVMTLQALISLVTIGLVISRAVNILAS